MTDNITASQAGDALPELVFGPITRGMLALYAGASGDHNPVHIDLDFARKAKLPDVFAQGMLSFGVLARVATQWAGSGRLREFGARFLSITQVGDIITCRGVVTERLSRDGEDFLRVAVTAVAQDGRETLSGDALIAIN
jgi:acyl dehydratase